MLKKPESIFSNPTRLYNLQELAVIFRDREMEIREAYADFNTAIPACEDVFQIQVFSQKN